VAGAVLVDGEPHNAWAMEGDDLVIDLPGSAHQVTIETTIDPTANTQLSGLYASGGLLCTQCEAEGFRRITFFPDRPDVLSCYTVTLTADKAQFPVLLSNGNPVDSGEEDDGSHWAIWHDPWPKPSYLFALVAGDLVPTRDRFTTASGREVDLAIWVRAGDETRTGHAMRSLIASMRGTRRSMAANTISTCSTSSPCPISTPGRWRTRASTSSTPATSWPTRIPPPMATMTRSKAWWPTNTSTTGRATA
jgi:aminopeptidase N